MKFITNIENHTLLDFFSEEIKNVKEIKILVGYCYFSAFTAIANDPEILKTFQNANVKILMGMHIDPHLKYEYSKYDKDADDDSEEAMTPYEIKEKETMNFLESANSESPSDIEGIEALFSKVKNGTFEIKKTIEDIHAKIYIFIPENRNSMSSGVFVTGSSNLTLSGVKYRREFNISESDYEHVKKAEEFFDELWKDENSVSILNINNYESIFEKTGLMYMASPYKIFQKIVYEYFEYTNRTELEHPPSRWDYKNYQYQIDAIKDGISIVKNYNGALIADVVGLGKSIIASAIAKNLLEENVINGIYIICPPHIKNSWENYSDNFNLNARVRSIGLLNNIEEELSKKQKRNYLIIVDEAHNFRNNKTESYAKMKNICFGNKTLLLTATPMHNTTSDIFSLIELFDGKLNEEIDLETLKNEILKEEKEIRKEYQKENSCDTDKEKLSSISKQIISYISPILIRRTRKDLEENIVYKKDLDMQEIKLNNIKDPILYDYTLEEMSDLYINTLEKISPYEDKKESDNKNRRAENETKINHFRGIRYKPLCYLKEDNEKTKKIVEDVFGDGRDFNFALTSSRNLSKFMRHLLIRRFESSIGAFRKTIDNLVIKYENIYAWMGHGLFPIYKKGDILNVEDFIEYANTDETDYLDDEDVESKFEFNKEKKYEYELKGLYIIENIKDILTEDFFKDFENDLSILKDIQKDWAQIEKDKKLDKLVKCILDFKKENPERKIIVFSEFLDTVDYLYEKIEKDKTLKEILKSIKFSSKDKNLKKTVIEENFDASNKNKKDDYFLLITTDTLSEGINLHRAGIVINYDIPYNPTRVVQRVGRINRIEKKSFDNLYICNFLPRIEAQKEIKNWQISNFKLTLINAVLGNDTKILQKEDEIKSLFSIKEKRYIEDDLSWDTKYKNIYNDIKTNDAAREEIEKMPSNLFVRRGNNFNGIIQVIRIGAQISAVCLKNDVVTYNIADIFSLLEASVDEKYQKPSMAFAEIEKKFKFLKKKRSKKYHHDAVIYLKEYRDELKKNGNKKDEYYIENIIKFAEEKKFASFSLNAIVKVFKKHNNKNKTDLIKNIIPEYVIHQIKSGANSDRNKRVDLIATEEIIDISIL